MLNLEEIRALKAEGFTTEQITQMVGKQIRSKKEPAELETEKVQYNCPAVEGIGTSAFTDRHGKARAGWKVAISYRQGFFYDYPKTYEQAATLLDKIKNDLEATLKAGNELEKLYASLKGE